MSDSNLGRSGAVGGIVFVVLLAINAIVGGQPPAADSSRAEITQYLANHEAGLRSGVWLLGLAAVALAWWFGVLWRRIRPVEAGTDWLAVVALLGLAIAGPLAVASSVLLAATAAHISEVGDSGPFLYETAAMLLGAEGFALAIHLLAANLLGTLTGSLPRWQVILGLVSAIGFLASAVLSAAGTDVNNVLGLLAFVLWCTWILSVSYGFWRDNKHRVAVA